MKSQRYRVYSEHLQEKFGGRVYKLPINLPGTCPNRDGIISEGGCSFCDPKGSGFECLPSSLEIKEQLERNIKFFRKKFKAEKFISYLQAFTNTYFPLAQFMEICEAATEGEDIVGLSISTRPDCIEDRYLDYLEELKKRKGLTIDVELGLQTVNYHTLSRVNRGHTLAEFIDASLRVKQRGLELVAHVILNLPGDDRLDVIESAKIISALSFDYVKLHSLYLVKQTSLGESYNRGEFELIEKEEYIRRIALFLEYLSPEIVVQRLVGKGPRKEQYFCNWATSWWKLKEELEDFLEREDTEQGRRFDYLNGKAIRKKFPDNGVLLNG